MRRIFKVLALQVFIVVMIAKPCEIFAQSLKQLQSLSSINVDDLSDTQIEEYMKKAKMNDLTPTQLEEVAKRRGMGQEQIDKLKQRIAKIQQAQIAAKNDKKYTNTKSAREYNFGEEYGKRNKGIGTIEDSMEVLKYDEVFDKLEKKIFGASLFSNENLTFEPNLNLATPKNYQLGPGDELRIDIYGLNEESYSLIVTPEGNVRVPLVAPINVSGLTIEQATNIITSRLSQIYVGIKEGSTFVLVGLGNIRSIKVTLIGEVIQPGSYTLPSLASVFNALYACGGPSENGSFRNIQVVRNNKVIAILDVYDFLLKGDQKTNIRLEDQDVIRVNPYITRVSVFGEVKIPAFFEVLDKETLKDVLAFSGGFTDKAYAEMIKVLKSEKRERKIADIKSTEFQSYRPQNGDRYVVEQILNRYSNRVIIKGAVYREGPFELVNGLTLKGLIEKADGVRGDAFFERGIIKRTREDYSTEIISFNLKDILNGNTQDIQLVKDDEVIIESLLDLKEAYSVTIEGEVLKPGIYKYADNMILEDILLLAGSFKDAASVNNIEISRRVRDSINVDNSKAILYKFKIEGNIAKNSKESNFKLQPFDIVYVRKSPFYTDQENVLVEGELMYPGRYTLIKKETRVSDIINRAGGLTKEAYPKGATLLRQSQISQAQKEIAAQKLRKLSETGDSVNIDLKEVTATKEFVGIDLDKIIKKPGSQYDLILKEGDVIKIPRKLETVKIAGEVFYPVSVRYVPGKRAKYYVSQSGGFTEGAKKSKLYVLNPNGSVNNTGKFLFFNKYPKVSPGSEIIVPQKVEGKGLSTQETLSISSATASMALVIITLVNLLNK